MELIFNGNFGDEDNNFLFIFNNGFVNVGMDFIGRYFKFQKEGVFCLFICFLQQLFIFCGYYVESGDERGICFIVSYDNINWVFCWYSGIVQFFNEKVLKINVIVFGSKVEVILSYFNFGYKKGINFRGLFLDKMINVVGFFVDVGEEKGLSFNVLGFDMIVEVVFIFLNFLIEKSMKFNVFVINKIIEVIWFYVNSGNEKGFKMNVVVMNYFVQSFLVF